jgi:hypothetical protein
VVDVPVGEQDGDGLQPVLREQRVQLLDDLDPRVDDEALFAGSGGHDVAVGAERRGGEAGDEHGGTFRSVRSPVGTAGWRCDARRAYRRVRVPRERDLLDRTGPA